MENTADKTPEEYAAASERTLRRLAVTRLRGAKVWLFGSRATGKANRRSDFDVAYLPGEGFDRHSVARLREDIERSNIIYRVDLTDLSDASEDFREKVLKDGIPWKS